MLWCERGVAHALAECWPSLNIDVYLYYVECRHGNRDDATQNAPDGFAMSGEPVLQVVRPRNCTMANNFRYLDGGARKVCV